MLYTHNRERETPTHSAIMLYIPITHQSHVFYRQQSRDNMCTFTLNKGQFLIVTSAARDLTVVDGQGGHSQCVAFDGLVRFLHGLVSCGRGGGWGAIGRGLAAFPRVDVPVSATSNDQLTVGYVRYLQIF